MVEQTREMMGLQHGVSYGLFREPSWMLKDLF